MRTTKRLVLLRFQQSQRSMLTKHFPTTVEASDPDGDTLSYYLTQAPTGLSIDRSTGAISWQPTNEQAGSNLVEVQVLDGKGKV